MRIFSLSFFLLIVTLSCYKDPQEIVNDFTACHLDAALTFDEFEHFLIGSWVFDEGYCAGGDINPSHKGMILEFSSNGLMTCTTGDTSVITSDWSLVEAGRFYQIFPDPFELKNMGIQGLLLMCNEEILFELSSGDGCDRYFKRF